MLDFLRWLISQRDSNKDRERTKDTAHNRLRLVLIQDRLDLSPELMAAMKRDIRQVVSRYMVVDDDFIEFEVRRLDELMVLVSNIEVKELNQLAPAYPSGLERAHAVTATACRDGVVRPLPAMILRRSNWLLSR